MSDRPSQERRTVHPGDLYLRLHSFTIYARPKSGPALWWRGGVVYREPDAVALCEEAEDATAGKPAAKGVTAGR